MFPFQHTTSWKKLDIWAHYFPLCSCLHKLWFTCIVVSSSRVTSLSPQSDFHPCCCYPPLPDTPLPHSRAALNSAPSLVLCVYMCLCHWCGFSIPEQAQGLSHRKVSVVLLSLHYHPPPPRHTHTPLVYGRACLSMCVHTFRKKDVAHNPSGLCTFLNAWAGRSSARSWEELIAPHTRSRWRFPPWMWTNCERSHGAVDAVCFRWLLGFGFWCGLTVWADSLVAAATRWWQLQCVHAGCRWDGLPCDPLWWCMRTSSDSDHICSHVIRTSLSPFPQQVAACLTLLTKVVFVSLVEPTRVFAR